MATVSAITEEYIAAAEATERGASADAPVGETGDLAGSGQVGTLVSEGNSFYIDVSFGDGEATPHGYSYPEGDATTEYPAGGMEADGYTWFVELGHLSRAGNPVPAQPFLGPNFDGQVQELLPRLEAILEA